MNSETKAVQKLASLRQRLAVAESCTGGLLAHRLTNVPGASGILAAGLITYSNAAKTSLLNIPAQALVRYGAVSEEVATQMARNVRKLFQTNFGIGISGIAGPEGGTKRKPVGLVYIAVSTPAETLCLKCQFAGTRAQIKQQSTTQALKALLEFLPEI